MAKALVVFKNGSSKILPYGVAEKLWWIVEGGEKPQTDAQARYCAYVKRVYLDRKRAPELYLQKHALSRSEPLKVEPTQLWWQKL